MGCSGQEPLGGGQTAGAWCRVDAEWWVSSQWWAVDRQSWRVDGS